MRDEAEIFAETEGGDTLVEGSAAAMEKALEQRLETEGAGDTGLDFDELSGGELFPPRADGRIVAEAAEEESDFGKREAHVAGKANEQNVVESIRRVATLAAHAVRRGKQAESFVVADGGSVEAGAMSELADFHGFLLGFEGGPESLA